MCGTFFLYDGALPAEQKSHNDPPRKADHNPLIEGRAGHHGIDVNEQTTDSKDSKEHYNSMPFENVKLNDGNEIPEIGFGTGSALYRKDATDSVIQAIEAGFSHLDTAQIYDNEESVGEAIRETGLLRNDLFVTTKYWQGPIQTSIRESLQKLGLKYVDLYLIHQPRFAAPDFEGTWREFEKIKDDGLARSIGVSNFNLTELQTIVKTARIKPAVNQILFHPYNYAENKALLEYSAKHGIVTAAYSSLAPITKYPGGPVDAPVNAAAQRLSITPNQVIFLWVKAKGVVIITTSSKKKRLEEYLAVGDLPSLTEEEIAAIDAAGVKGPPAKINRWTKVAKCVVGASAAALALRGVVSGWGCQFAGASA
ncbi:hypothetical protein H0H92_010817 [Tricholoma furcatifolium]|nr:hypothetical protein H0H92_010817 [Tricholoma furcatifolium]